jgi:hypothetical protein
LEIARDPFTRRRRFTRLYGADPASAQRVTAVLSTLLQQQSCG